jgi:AraC-like DNA-binding protein
VRADGREVSAVDGSAVQRIEVHTRDQDVAATAINRIASHRARITFHEPTAAAFDIRSAAYDGFAVSLTRVDGLTYGGTLAESGNAIGLALVDGDGGGVSVGGADAALVRNGGLLYPPGKPIEVAFRDSTIAVVLLPEVEVAQLAEEATGLPAAALRFESMAPVSEPMRQYWCRTVGFLQRQLNTPEIDTPPLVVAELRRLAAAALLSVFPNTATTVRLPDAGRAAPAVVRRAIAHIDARAGAPVTLTEIADAVGLSPRALQEAFRRHLDTTPMAYLRRARLERAHRDLRTADPAGATTVAAIARRWGYTNPGRFSVDYRAAYGQPPSHTLRT